MDRQNWTVKVFNYNKKTIKGEKLLAVYEYFGDDCPTKESVEMEINTILYPPNKYFVELHNPSLDVSFVESYWR